MTAYSCSHPSPSPRFFGFNKIKYFLPIHNDSPSFYKEPAPRIYKGLIFIWEMNFHYFANWLFNCENWAWNNTDEKTLETRNCIHLDSRALTTRNVPACTQRKWELVQQWLIRATIWVHFLCLPMFTIFVPVYKSCVIRRSFSDWPEIHQLVQLEEAIIKAILRLKCIWDLFDFLNSW